MFWQDDLSNDEWRLVVKLKNLFKIQWVFLFHPDLPACLVSWIDFGFRYQRKSKCHMFLGLEWASLLYTKFEKELWKNNEIAMGVMEKIYWGEGEHTKSPPSAAWLGMAYGCDGFSIFCPVLDGFNLHLLPFWGGSVYDSVGKYRRLSANLCGSVRCYNCGIFVPPPLFFSWKVSI